MRTVTDVEARTNLSELLDAVEAGEEVTITRRGEVVARLAPPTRRKLKSRAASRSALGPIDSTVASPELIREMRDSDRSHADETD